MTFVWNIADVKHPTIGDESDDVRACFKLRVNSG